MQPEEVPVAEVEIDEKRDIELRRPKDCPVIEEPWRITASNKRVQKSWSALCDNTPSNARNCFRWLEADAMRPIPRRCYPLRGTENAGCWCYEIGAGDRVYYKVDVEERKALVYFAGPHPSGLPTPPSG